jgi:hypothetical protein
MGGHAPLILTRWFADRPPHPFNLVLLMRPYALELEEKGHDAFPPEARQRIEDRLQWAEEVCLGSWSPHKANGHGQASSKKETASKKASGVLDEPNGSLEGKHRRATAGQLAVGVGALLGAFYIGYISGKVRR